MSSDVFERVEAQIVAVGELLETARRYRPLEADAHRLYLVSARIGSRLRQASREAAGGGIEAAETIERELESVLEEGHAALQRFLASAAYRDFIARIQAGETEEVARRVCEVFADVEPAALPGLLYYPITGKREEGMLEPEAGVERIARMVEQGFESSRGVGVGGDANVHPLRFYESPEGIDAAVFLVVHGSEVEVPAFRATVIGEVLYYTPRLRAPFEVALRTQSPDDWLEIRPGGYVRYRERWRELLRDHGLTAREI